MIITTNTFLAIDKDLAMTEFSSGLPDHVLQPSCAGIVATQLEIFITHHVEQNQCGGISEFVCGAQL